MRSLVKTRGVKQNLSYVLVVKLFNLGNKVEVGKWNNLQTHFATYESSERSKHLLLTRSLVVFTPKVLMIQSTNR